MIDPTIVTKIAAFLQTSIVDFLPDLYELLLNGQLREVEQLLADRTVDLHSEVMEALLPAAARSFSRNHQVPQGVKTTIRSHRIRIATGRQVEVSSPYYKIQGENDNFSRRPLFDHWQTIDSFSPLLYDRVGYMAMLAPSYDLAHQGVTKFGMDICLSSVQKITDRLAERCEELGHENLIIEPRYDVEGKTIIISIDGGRTRMREYTGQLNKNGQATYQTPWREPKLFVIDVLDKDGRPDRHELPIYGCQFKEEDVVKLLERYLKKLDIQKAERVQLIADGAPWIWNRLPLLLHDAGVEKQRLIQTLDFYHATQYVHSLVEAMPKRIGKKERKRHLKESLEQVKRGQINPLVEKLKSIFLRASALVKRWIDYLDKHASRMQYTDYESNGLMRGSGIIESAIRRIINLRFKNASTFWLQENVEKLYFLRAALVAGRWDVVMGNLNKSS